MKTTTTDHDPTKSCSIRCKDCAIASKDRDIDELTDEIDRLRARIAEMDRFLIDIGAVKTPAEERLVDIFRELQEVIEALDRGLARHQAKKAAVALAPVVAPLMARRKAA